MCITWDNSEIEGKAQETASQGAKNEVGTMGRGLLRKLWKGTWIWNFGFHLKYNGKSKWL